MYEVSEEYKEYMRRPSSVRHLYGSVGGISTFTEADILEGSFTVENKCAERGELKIGSVYIGSLSCTFRTGFSVNRSNWEGLEISVYEGLELENSIEYVPLGVFYVAEADHGKSGTSITAYDAMARLDKAYSGITTYGTAYGLMTIACNECGVTFGMTEEEVEALTNGNEVFALYDQNDIETWRDFVFYVAQACASFATINRSGELVLRQYQQASIGSISASLREDNSSFSDFTTRYSGISFVHISDKSTRYYNVNPDEYLTYNLGTNPFLQYGTNTHLELVVRNILNKLAELSITPFESNLLDTPAYDLGDTVEMTGGLSNHCYSNIMAFDYRYNKQYKVSGYGKNPSLASAKSKSDKSIAGLISQVDGQTLKTYNYQNAVPYHIGEGQTVQIMDKLVGSTKDGILMFFAEILHTVGNSGGKLKVKYVYENNELPWYPTEKYSDGEHILNLYFPFVSEENTVKRLQVLLTAENGAFDIAIGDIRATLMGQGIVGDGVWDGRIQVEDNMQAIPTDFDYTVVMFDDIAEIRRYIPDRVGISDAVGLVNIDDILVLNNITGNVYINKTIMRNKTWGQISSLTWAALKDGYLW